MGRRLLRGRSLSGSSRDVWRFGPPSGVTEPAYSVNVNHTGMRPQSMVDDADEAELLQRLPRARVERVAEAGHSVQGDQPLLLAELLAAFGGAPAEL